MRICFFLMFLAACGGPSEFAKQHELKVQAAREGCAAGARQHEQYMRLTPPSTVTGQVAQQWNQQMERKIASALEVCKPAMRLGQHDAWLHAEMRYSEGHEKLLQDLTAMMPVVEKSAQPDMLRFMIDAANQARSHYGYAIEPHSAQTAAGPATVSRVKARIAKLDEVYNKLKAVQAQQYE